MFGARRIASRIFFGYLLLLLFFLVMGTIVPYLFSVALSQAAHDDAGTVRFEDDAFALRRSAIDSENELRGFLLYGDAKSRQQFTVSRREYRDHYFKMEDYLGKQKDDTLSTYLSLADSSYAKWLQTKATPEFEAADRSLDQPRNEAVERAAADRSAKSFEGVSQAMDRLVDTASTYQSLQMQRTQQSEEWRNLLSVATPVVAAILAVIFARNFTLGITRPIEALRLAAEEVERGDTTQLLFEDYSGDTDEIGDLGKALSRMAETIGERETVLRAQNEALAAIGRRIEAVLNATNDGIVLLDRAEGFSLVNARFATMFGLNADDVLDQTFAQAGALFLDHFKDKAAAKHRFHEWIADPDAIADETMDVVEPTQKVLRIYTAPVRGDNTSEEGRSPEILGRIFVFRDVTRETIVDRMKTEFVSTVSHELRTPLTAIKGYVDLMTSGKTGPLTEIQAEFLTMVQASTRRLTDLINDMLDISRIESGRITVRREAVDYVPLVREAVRMMANQADARSITLTFAGPATPLPPVRGDVDRITQVLVNLLSNAIKYTPAGGHVTVTTEAEEGIVTTCVADDGIGIGAEDQAKLFQKFFRADNSTTREVGGTGLGLAITKAILERMHGTIRVDSESGKGSRFYFTLPASTGTVKERGARREVAPVASLQPSPAGVADNSPNRCLLLIVDEDPGILHRMGGLFRGRGFVTSGAMNISEANRRARDLHPDAVLLNLIATKLNTIGLLYNLRAKPETSHLPVFAVTMRHLANAVDSRPSLVIVPHDAPPVDGALLVTEADTAATFQARLTAAKPTVGEDVPVEIRLADFSPSDLRAESLAIALQQHLIRGKGIILHIRDFAEGEGNALVSLTSPENLQIGSVETIAEAVGKHLRQS